MTAHQAWTPQPKHFDTAHVLKLAERLGVPDYDALLALSVEKPDVYWQTASGFLGIVWDKAPDGYVDLSRGREFPQWWPGARLNWVNTVLAHAESAPDRIALVDEAEDGTVRRLSFAELAVLVRRCAHGLRQQGIGRGDRVGLLIDNGIEATVSLSESDKP